MDCVIQGPAGFTPALPIPVPFPSLYDSDTP